MKIFPAIDIKDKKCVRLVKGDFENKTEYETSPIDQAGKYKKHGFKNLHIVKEQAIPDGNFSTVKSPNPEEPEALNMAKFAISFSLLANFLL